MQLSRARTLLAVTVAAGAVAAATITSTASAYYLPATVWRAEQALTSGLNNRFSKFKWEKMRVASVLCAAEVPGIYYECSVRFYWMTTSSVSPPLSYDVTYGPTTGIYSATLTGMNNWFILTGAER